MEIDRRGLRTDPARAKDPNAVRPIFYRIHLYI
jgi:hypothetical protein